MAITDAVMRVLPAPIWAELGGCAHLQLTARLQRRCRSVPGRHLSLHSSLLTQREALLAVLEGFVQLSHRPHRRRGHNQGELRRRRRGSGGAPGTAACRRLSKRRPRLALGWLPSVLPETKRWGEDGFDDRGGSRLPAAPRPLPPVRPPTAGRGAPGVITPQTGVPGDCLCGGEGGQT